MEDNVQNLNNSPSPGGDGVQSAAAERSAAGLYKTDNQPGQQRVNAAERRERGEAAKEGDKAGERASLIQSPGEVLPDTTSAVDAAERSRKEKAEAEHKEKFGHLPEATLSEMDAGRSALKRTLPTPPAPSNPVDDLAARKSE